MSVLPEDVEPTKQSRVNEPAQTLDYEERLLIAKHIVQSMRAAGIDCDLAAPVVTPPPH